MNVAAVDFGSSGVSMYCSTCGTRVPMGATRCDSCGAALRATVPERLPATAPQLPRVATESAVIGSCVRCGYRGQGLSYFSRGSHVAALLGLSIVTAGAMGMGGILYYFLRRDHQICPHCRASWGQYGERALARSVAGPDEPRVTEPSFSRTGSGKRALSILLFVLAAALAVGGVAATAVQPFIVAGAATLGGLLLQHSAEKDRQGRRVALLASLQPHVLQLAARHGARLTVSGVAAELGWSLRRAEKVLQSLDDGVRVSSEVTDEGVIVYEFRELSRSLERPA